MAGPARLILAACCVAETKVSICSETRAEFRPKVLATFATYQLRKFGDTYGLHTHWPTDNRVFPDIDAAHWIQ